MAGDGWVSTARSGRCRRRRVSLEGRPGSGSGAEPRRWSPQPARPDGVCGAGPRAGGRQAVFSRRARVPHHPC